MTGVELRDADGWADDRTTLSTPSGAPVRFLASVTPWSGARERRVVVTGPDPVTGTSRVRDYLIPRAEHDAYLDWWVAVGRDFGTRLPCSRERAEPPGFQAPYRVHLTEPLSPDMPYGYGDPSVLRVDAAHAPGGRAAYYAVVTSNDAPDAFPVIRSDDLEQWTLAGFAFPRGHTPGWAAVGEHVSDYWAPELHRVGGAWRLYFVARDRVTRELCIGVATGPAPEGPFHASPEPLLRGGVIDPHVLVEPDGSAFLYWKEDTNDAWPGRLAELLFGRPWLAGELFADERDRRTAALAQTLWPWIRRLEPMERFFALQPLIEAVSSGFPAFHHRLAALAAAERDAAGRVQLRGVLEVLRTPVLAQRLAADGLSLVGDPARVLENDQEWEGHLIEGIWVARRRQRYFMFYAGNDFSTPRYGVGVAVAPSPMAPFRKQPGPLLQSTREWVGPGHPSLADGPDGEPRLFVHAFRPGEAGYKRFRALLSVGVAFEDERVRLR